MFPTQSCESVIPENASLLQCIRRILMSSPYPEIQIIKVKIHYRTVFLHGLVSSYFQKQVAQELVKGVIGPLALQNELRVDPEPK